jgi:hypothetical protein
MISDADKIVGAKHDILVVAIEPEFHCHCGAKLIYFSGLESIPEHLFCPVCMDIMYSPETGEIIGRLE